MFKGQRKLNISKYLYIRPSAFPASCLNPSLLGVKPRASGAGAGAGSMSKREYSFGASLFYVKVSYYGAWRPNRPTDRPEKDSTVVFATEEERSSRV